MGERSGALLELHPEDQKLNPKVHTTTVDVTLFQLIERFMRYRVGIRPLRWLYSKDYVPIEGSMDYICQDLIIDAYTILGLHEGRKHWGGLEGVAKGCMRILSNPLSPREAWFKHTDEFTAKFLIRKDGRSVSSIYREYKPPTPPDGKKPPTNTKPEVKKEEGMSTGRMILVAVLIIGLILVLAFAGYVIYRRIYQQDTGSSRESLVDLEADKGGIIRDPAA